jgi:3-oxoacyl-(acyl-carrier-protein) synthase
MRQRRVVVTGLGLVSPLGKNVQSSWDRLLDKYNPMVTFSDENSDETGWDDIGYRTGSRVHEDFDMDYWKTYLKDDYTYVTSLIVSAVDEALKDSGYFPETREQ